MKSCHILSIGSRHAEDASNRRRVLLLSREAMHASKMSMEGWWMVQTTVRPVLTVLRTVRITIAAARASRPEQAPQAT